MSADKVKSGQFEQDATKSKLALDAQKAQIGNAQNSQKHMRNTLKQEERAANKLKGPQRTAALAAVKQEQATLKQEGRNLKSMKKEEGKLKKGNQVCWKPWGLRSYSPLLMV